MFHFFKENLNLEGHLNRLIGSKVTAILVNGGFYLGVEHHREGLRLLPAQQACLLGSRNKPIFKY